MDYLLTFKAHLRLYWRFRDGIKPSDAKFLRNYLKLFLRKGSYKNPGENQVSGICISSHEHEGEHSHNLFCEINSPIKPKMFYTMSDCYCLNLAQSQTLSALPGLALGVGQAEA
jgi:hypothetical protein